MSPKTVSSLAAQLDISLGDETTLRTSTLLRTIRRMGMYIEACDGVWTVTDSDGKTLAIA